MKRVFTALFFCLAILFGIAESVSGAAVTFDAKNRVGGFEWNTNIYTYEIGPQTLQPPWEDTMWGYDVATGVGDYANQNPWSAFDPHGLETVTFVSVKFNNADSEKAFNGVCRQTGVKVLECRKLLFARWKI